MESEVTESSVEKCDESQNPVTDAAEPDSPSKGARKLSVGSSGWEALDPHDPRLNQLANDMFKHTAKYLQGELSGVQDDYQLLEAMNKATVNKYADMKQIAANVGNSLDILNDKYVALVPFLEQIEQLDKGVSKLEQAAYRLDAYSKKLEAKFKSLEKR